MAKKHVSDFYELPNRVDRFINLKDTQLTKKSNQLDKMRDNEGASCDRSKGEPGGRFNPLDLKNEHYISLITCLTRMLIAIDWLTTLQWPIRRRDPSFLNLNNFAGITRNTGTTPTNVAS
ncbi:UNVERIFIED_CONTAM: hypothetical protein Sradi_1757800 [Sesamum radiatum]|uniref:Uncharacterized protein n=1 Tax=Sesamum radiatum TaxID=300843 RepID=A0AAW2TU80_SESRA